MNMMCKCLLLSFLLMQNLCVSAQKELQLADSVVKYQMKSGGWPKNQDWLSGPDSALMRKCQETGVGSTIDNGATVAEMKALTNAVRYIEQSECLGEGGCASDVMHSKKMQYRESFVRAVEYLLDMQYENGGFPQFYPPKQKTDYSTHITFNDNAMIRVMLLLREVADGHQYDCMGVDADIRGRCRAAFDKGVDCILNCQIRLDECGEVVKYGSQKWDGAEKTVWCQQHDENTFMPAKARAYELPSFTAYGETVDILDFLMSIENPSEDVKAAVACGVAWLERHSMKDAAVEWFVDDEGRKDWKIVEKTDAPLLWARFYDLKTQQPYFCGRDGMPKSDVSDISYERRNGYSWIGDSPRKVINKYYNMYAR